MACSGSLITVPCVSFEVHVSGLQKKQLTFPKNMPNLTPQVSSVDNLCKQFGPRSGPTKMLGLIWVQTV